MRIIKDPMFDSRLQDIKGISMYMRQCACIFDRMKEKKKSMDIAFSE